MALLDVFRGEGTSGLRAVQPSDSASRRATAPVPEWSEPFSPGITPVIDLRSVAKVCVRGAEKRTILDGITFQVREGEFVALMGPSGSGKTTLLNLVAGIDRCSSGRLVVAGTEVSRLSESDAARWRSRNVGFIFQFDTLIPVLNAVENVELPLLLVSWSRKERRARALNALQIVGLGDQVGHYPRQLSRDERQRLAIARAIVVDPKVLVADEPTGHLDACSAARILTLLQRLNGDFGKTLVLVTRDPEIAVRADTRYQVDKGVLSFANPDHPHSRPLSVARGTSGGRR